MLPQVYTSYHMITVKRGVALLRTRSRRTLPYKAVEREGETILAPSHG